MCLSEYTQALHMPDSSTLLNKSGYLTLSSCCQDILCPNPTSLLTAVSLLAMTRSGPGPGILGTLLLELQQLLPAPSFLKTHLYFLFGSIWLLWPTSHPGFTSYLPLSTP